MKVLCAVFSIIILNFILIKNVHGFSLLNMLSQTDQPRGNNALATTRPSSFFDYIGYSTNLVRTFTKNCPVSFTTFATTIIKMVYNYIISILTRNSFCTFYQCLDNIKNLIVSYTTKIFFGCITGGFQKGLLSGGPISKGINQLLTMGMGNLGAGISSVFGGNVGSNPLTTAVQQVGNIATSFSKYNPLNLFNSRAIPQQPGSNNPGNGFVPQGGSNNVVSPLGYLSNTLSDARKYATNNPLMNALQPVSQYIG